MLNEGTIVANHGKTRMEYGLMLNEGTIVANHGIVFSFTYVT